MHRSRTKTSTESDKDGFSPAVFRLRLEQKKLLLLNVCECYVCVMFSMAKSMFRIGSCTRVCCHKILFLRAKCDKGSP